MSRDMIGRLPPHFPDAACRDHPQGSDPWFPPQSRQRAELHAIAVRVCAGCPHRTECAQWAADNGERGVWGGKTETDRRWDRWPHLRPPLVERRPTPIRHGTYAGHRAHQRQGVPMCEPCAKAAAEYQQRRQQARTARRQAGRALRSVN